MTKYARILPDLTVKEWINLDDPSVIAPQKKWSDGGLHVRPVEEGPVPKYRPELAKLDTVITIEPARVLVTHNVLPHGEEVQRLAVKLEARRRILARFPEWKQQNMTARSVELQDIWRLSGSWTEQEQEEADAIKQVWAWVKTVRYISDGIEAMNPIPDDYDADHRWSFEQ